MLENFPFAPNSPWPGTSPGVSSYPSLHEAALFTLSSPVCQSHWFKGISYRSFLLHCNLTCTKGHIQISFLCRHCLFIQVASPQDLGIFIGIAANCVNTFLRTFVSVIHIQKSSCCSKLSPAWKPTSRYQFEATRAVCVNTSD